MNKNLLTLRTYSLSYQHINNEERVPRPNLVSDIEDMFEKDCKIVIIEGKEGGGKTDILLQFSRKHSFDAITYFINPAFRTSFRQDYLMEDIGRQIYFFNKNEPAPSDLEITESVFNKLTFDLTTSPGRKNRPVYFLIDALDQIDKSDFELLRNTLQNLPWNTNNFYFLLSGSLEKLIDILPGSWLKNYKSLRVPRFTEPETKQLFMVDDSIESQRFIYEVHNTWKGHPEILSQVKRILDSGISKESFLEDSTISEKNDLLEIEWRRATLDDLDLSSEKLLLIAILSFDDNIRNIVRLASILNISTIEFQELISNISFLKITEENIAFVSNSYRNYARHKLSKYERETNSILINFYMSIDDLSSVMNLPNLYLKNDQWTSIVKFLTIDNLDLIITNSKSFSEIKKQMNYGYKAAKNIKNAYNDIFRFSLHRSILSGLQSSDNRKDKIRAFIVLDKPEEAFNIIANSVLKEDRLKMLIFFAQYSKIEEKEVDKLVISEIKDLLEDVDFDYLRENLMEMAIGLAHFLPNSAIQIIEKALNLKEDNNSIEWLIGIIGIIAYQNKEVSEDSTLNIKSNDTKKETFGDEFAKSIGYGIGDVAPEEIINEIEKIEKPTDRIFLLKKWIQNNPKSFNIYDIINYAINLISQESSSYKPSTKTLYEIVFPIKFFKEKIIVDLMVKRIDDMMLIINSPTVGKVMLDIIIIEALMSVDIENANNRTIALTKFINNLSDVCIKLECYAHLWKMYNDIQLEKQLDLDSLLIDEKFLKGEISHLLSQFLNSIADQYDEIKEVLIVIAKFNFSYALYISSTLNTSFRRDNACLTCLESYIDVDIDKWNLDDIEYAINQITITEFRTNAIELVFERAFELKDQAKNRKDIIKDLLPLINLSQNPEIKCKLIALSISLLGLKQTNNPKYLPRYDQLIGKLNNFLLNDYTRIENPISKINMGYKLATSLGNYSKELGNGYFDLAESTSKETTFEDVKHLFLLKESIRIVLRIYSGICRKGEISFEKITSLITVVPTKEDQIDLWSELAVRIYLTGKIDLSSKIVKSKITPVLDIYEKNTRKSYFLKLFIKAASAIHMTQPATFKLYTKNLTSSEKELVLHNIFTVLLNNCHESDPYDNFKGSSHFIYEHAMKYLELLELVETDGLIHYYIRRFTEVIKANPNNFTRIQKPELYQKLSNLISRTLPNIKTGINHDGYLISALACLENLSLDNTDKISKRFEILEKRAANIPNITDRAVVYLNIANEYDFNKKKKNELYKLAFSEIALIPSITERISMYESALEAVSKSSIELFKQYLNVAENDIYKLDENEQYPTFRKLIDMAYRCDKNIAQRLVSNLDTDPARKNIAEPANNHFEKLDLEKSAQSDYSTINKIKERREKSNFAWNLLAQLNSDKRKSRDINETISFLHSGSVMPFFYSVPLYEFFIENIVKSDDKDNLLHSLYDSAIANSKLCYNLICNISNKNHGILNYHIESGNNSIVVNPGMAIEAYNFIKNFMSNTESKEIYIIDPYFSENDMEFLKKVDEWCFAANTTVLGSCEGSGNFTKKDYLDAWENVSSEITPANTFIRVKNQNNKSPFHDRYILLFDKKLGLRLGASIHGIEGRKSFEISKMLATEVDAIYDKIARPLIHQRLKEYMDQTIKYESFDF